MKHTRHTKEFENVVDVKRIKVGNVSQKKGKISSFEGGTLVLYEGKIYIVLLYVDNPSHIGAISLTDGGYLMPSTVVVPLQPGEIVTVTPVALKKRY